jgi:hypothetical protein
MPGAVTEGNPVAITSSKIVIIAAIAAIVAIVATAIVANAIVAAAVVIVATSIFAAAAVSGPINATLTSNASTSIVLPSHHSLDLLLPASLLPASLLPDSLLTALLLPGGALSSLIPSRGWLRRVFFRLQRFHYSSEKASKMIMLSGLYLQALLLPSLLVAISPLLLLLSLLAMPFQGCSGLGLK